MRKRIFDVVVIMLAAIAWVPVVLMAAAAVLLLSGRPVLYRSRRWVGPATAISMIKLRVMVPDAHRVTASAEEGRFLNTPPDSPLYTGVGRVLDRLGINEIPQFLHVLRGEMSIVGARPLTEVVRTALLEQHGDIDHRWETPAGLTGLPQLVGRNDLTDDERLHLEAVYSHRSATMPSLWLDLRILAYTVLITFNLMRPRTYAEALTLAQPKRRRAAARLRSTHTVPELASPFYPGEVDVA